MSKTTSYVALLRGINVGGNAKVSMSVLKETFENIGMLNVRTYINSGNVLFQSAESGLDAKIEVVIEKDFGFHVPVVVRDAASIAQLVERVPSEWNNDEMKTDVMFLWEHMDTPDVLDNLPITEVDRVLHLPGAIVWSYDRENAGKSGMYKIVGTKFYKNMTARNIIRCASSMNC